MTRLLLCCAVAAAIAILASSGRDLRSLYPGKVIRFADGSCGTIVARDPDALGWWRIRVAWASKEPVIVSMEANDLYELAQRQPELAPARQR
jgi:hypothetical protein